MGKGKDKSAIERAKTEGFQGGFVEGSATASVNIIIHILSCFPVDIQKKMISTVVQWHNIQKEKEKNNSKIIKLH